MRRIQEPTKYDFSELMYKIGRQDCLITFAPNFIKDVKEIFEANQIPFDDASYPLLNDIVLYGVILGREYERKHHLSMMRDKVAKRGNIKATAPNAR